MPTSHDTPIPPLAPALAARYAAFPTVRAVALGGSRAGALVDADAGSDLDFYVYAAPPLSLAERAAVAAQSGAAPGAELGNEFWESGDEWADAATGLAVDVTFRDPAWVEDDLTRLLDRHRASVGYTTAVWHNVRVAVPLSDRDGWFRALQAKAARPFPDELRRAIVATNHPILRRTRSSYRRQLEKALARADAVSLNHRTAAFLASYFDVLFALNRRTHPGEKRLLAHAEATCPRRPPHLARDLAALLAAAAGNDPALLTHLDALTDPLDALLADDGLL